MVLRLYCIALFLLSFIAPGVAQEGVCTATELPVGIDTPSGDSYRGIAPEDFQVRGTKGKISVTSLTYDDGPRRMVLVVDASKKLSPDTRKAEAQLVSTLAGTARSQDSVALIIARGPQHVVNFGEDRSVLSAALPREGDPRSGPELGVLDAVLKAINMFGEHKRGDAVIVIAAELQGSHHANPGAVAKQLEQHQVRMFGVALGPVSRGNIAAGGQATTAWGLATVTPGIGDFVYQTGDENFLPMTRDSGGAVLSAINGDPQESYRMNDPKMQEHVKHVASVVLNMVTGFYRAAITRSQPHPEEWTFEPGESLHKTAPRMVLLYPRQLGPC